jgi:hypothetical protein
MSSDGQGSHKKGKDSLSSSLHQMASYLNKDSVKPVAGTRNDVNAVFDPEDPSIKQVCVCVCVCVCVVFVCGFGEGVLFCLQVCGRYSLSSSLSPLSLSHSLSRPTSSLCSPSPSRISLSSLPISGMIL